MVLGPIQLGFSLVLVCSESDFSAFVVWFACLSVVLVSFQCGLTLVLVWF